LPAASVVPKVALNVPQAPVVLGAVRLNITWSPAIAPLLPVTVAVIACVVVPSALSVFASGLVAITFALWAGFVVWTIVPEVVPLVAASVAVTLQNPGVVDAV
jgi:hypothetical protein